MKVFICAIAFNLFLDKSFSHFHVLFVTFNNKDFFSATCLPDQVLVYVKFFFLSILFDQVI